MKLIQLIKLFKELFVFKNLYAQDFLSISTVKLKGLKN